MISASFLIVGLCLMIGVLLAPLSWFRKEGRFSKVDKVQFAGLMVIFAGIAWSFIDELWIS